MLLPWPTKDLYEVYGEETVAFLKEKSRFKENIDDMQTTCKLTDIVLKNNSVEMLLLKRDMEERFEVMLGSKLQPLPASIQHRVKVVPARVKLGSLAACGADDDEVDARPMVIVLEDDEEETSDDDSCSSEEDEEEEKGAGEKEKDVKNQEENGVDEKTELAREKLLKESANCDRDYFFARIVDAYVQTDEVIVQQVNVDVLKPRDSIADRTTQTECPDVEDRATSPAPIDTRDCCVTTSSPVYEDTDTMTDEPTVTRRQTQTDSIVKAERHQQTTDVRRSTTERATTTERVELSEENTDTSGLIQVCEQATCTVNATSMSVGVATDVVPTSDKSTAHAQDHRETVTSSVGTRDVAARSRLGGTDAGVGTEPTARSDASVFDHDACSSELLFSEPTLPGLVGEVTPRQVGADGTGSGQTKRVTCNVVTQTLLNLIGQSLLPNTIQCNKGTNTSTNTLAHNMDPVKTLGASKIGRQEITTTEVACGTDVDAPELAERPPMVTQATSMHRGMTAYDQATWTIATMTSDEATSMDRRVTAQDQATWTTATITSDEATSVDRLMTAHDQATWTAATTTADEATSMDRLMTAHDQATWTTATTTADEATSMDRLMTAHDQATWTAATTTSDEATSMDRLMTAHDQATWTAAT